MPKPVLYSANPWIKLHIQEKYRGDVHYVWCSEHFDSKTVSPYLSGSSIPSSSNPKEIYRRLSDDVKDQDLHSDRISGIKASLTKLALKWERDGEITKVQRQDIVYQVRNASFNHWRPLLYVIPRAAVEARMTLVPASQRAGLGDEYIIADLRRDEFDLIELF